MKSAPKATQEYPAISAIDEEPFTEANKKAKERYGRFNLLIVGRSGVGKSSLLNAVFGENRAAVGIGTPVTEGLTYYADDSLGIWDSQGFELGESKLPAERIKEDLQEIRTHPQEEQVSVVWFCVDAGSTRLLDGEIDVIREIDHAGLPVILVLTKVKWAKNPLTGKNAVADEHRDFWNWLHEPVARNDHPIDLPVRDIIATSTLGNKGKGKGHGLGELVEITLLEAPDDDKDAFRIVQRLNLPWKRKMARSIIATSIGATAVAAAVPIPVADAATLAPIQLAMMGRIAAIYELELKTMMSVGALAQLAAQATGRALARSFVKLIPGAGSVVNAAVASALTGASGEAWLKLCEQVYEGKIDVTDIEQVLEDFGPNFMDIVKSFLTNANTKK